MAGRPLLLLTPWPKYFNYRKTAPYNSYWFKPRFLKLATTDILTWIILCWGGCLVQYKVFAVSLASTHEMPAATPLVVTTGNVFRLLPNVPWEQNCPWLSHTGENIYWRMAFLHCKVLPLSWHFSCVVSFLGGTECDVPSGCIGHTLTSILSLSSNGSLSLTRCM